MDGANQDFKAFGAGEPKRNAAEALVLEPFVDAVRAGEFLSISPRRVLELARNGILPGRPLGRGRRKVWRFRLSELAAALDSRGVDWPRQSPAPR
jgi:hypothetical protein